ncbi:maestro heat-like repeat-containing protein family member 7 [Natator depressus]|uniref:maestro heat-like repeat-containing protein family member 7 n=1 Tax=Natator depressus TaxID=27790 RepID=UPI003EBC8D52
MYQYRINQNQVNNSHLSLPRTLNVPGTTLAKQSAEYMQVFREWRAENTFWVTWFTNTSNIAMMFGKYFNPSERMDFLLTAIEGMKDTSVHDSVAARHMLHVILWVPSPSLERVSEAVTSIYHNLDSISEPLAQQQLLKALVVLGHQYSEEVVTTLLGCSLSCDSVAVEMWRVLTSHPKTAGKVLRELLNTLQERPLHPHHDVSQQESLIQCAVSGGFLSESYTLKGHRDVKSTQCPGDALYEAISQWPEFEA